VSRRAEAVWAIALLLLATWAACADAPTSVADTAADTDTDAASDTATDTDAASDAASDADADTAADAAADTDTAADAVSDTGTDTTSDAIADTPADTATDASAWTFDAFLAQYGVITTVAGRGLVGDKGVNGWDPSFEGGPAVDAELSRPHIALAAPNSDGGDLYIADKDGHAVRRVTADGRIWTAAGTGVPGDDGDAPGPATERRLSSPNGLWVASDGTVYILDLGNDKVRRLSVDGQLSTLFVVGGVGAGRGLWVADDEALAYVAAGTQLKRWTPAGGVEVLADGFVSLGNLAVVPQGAPGGTASPDAWAGQLLVADRGGSRVYRVDPASGAKTVLAGTGTPDDLPGGGDGGLALLTGLDEVRGVWPHPRGGYLLACHKGDDVWFVDPDGVIHVFVEGKGGDTHAGDGLPVTAPGPKISEPRAVTMDAAGNVLITENDLGFVRRVERLP